MKKILALILLSITALSTTTADARCQEYDIRRAYVVGVCFGLNAITGFISNVVSDNTLKQKAIGNTTGSVFALGLNFLLKQALQEYNKDHVYIGIPGPLYIRHEPPTHLALATGGYIAGGTAGILVRGALNKTYDGIKNICYGIKNICKSARSNTKKTDNE